MRGTTFPIALVPHFAMMTVNPQARTPVKTSSITFNRPLVRPLTTASTSKPSTSSITAAARMILLARACSRFFAART